MMDFIVIFYSVIGLLVAVLLMFREHLFSTKGKDKVDKGFKVNYYQLSYRRKMIRTLISLPILILILFVFYSYIELSMSTEIFISISFFLLFSVQLIYTFYMWKKYEKQS